MFRIRVYGFCKILLVVLQLCYFILSTTYLGSVKLPISMNHESFLYSVQRENAQSLRIPPRHHAHKIGSPMAEWRVGEPDLVGERRILSMDKVKTLKTFKFKYSRFRNDITKAPELVTILYHLHKLSSYNRPSVKDYKS